MTCKFGFPMVAADRLDECADMAMDWLAKDQAFHEAHGGRNKSDYWRNQWQLHGAMLARIESRHGHEFMPKPTPTPARCGSTEHVPSCSAEAGAYFEMERKEPGKRCGTCGHLAGQMGCNRWCKMVSRHDNCKEWKPKPVKRHGSFTELFKGVEDSPVYKAEMAELERDGKRCGTCGTAKNGLTVAECRDCLPEYKNWTPKGGASHE